jgi:putative DNA methylase
MLQHSKRDDRRRKLIEVAVPLEAVDAEAIRRKQKAPKGYPTAIHKYWAQRPLAACRAVLFSQLVDDPVSWPDRFPTPDAQNAERRRLHGLIERLVAWDVPAAVMDEARWEIARSIAWGRGAEPPRAGDHEAVWRFIQRHAPQVFDPFCGGGSIPLEAQRLGLRTLGSDLNPVAVLISKALVEIPAKFASLSPINPEARGGPGLVERQWSGAQGLAEDIRYYGRVLLDKAEERLGRLYPKARLPNGQMATVIAWLWARTVRSPDPQARGAYIPLASTFLLSTKTGRKVWVEPIVDHVNRTYGFEVRSGILSQEQEATIKLGTKSAKGQAFRCIFTGAPVFREYIQSEGKAQRLGRALMAIVVDEGRNRLYLSPPGQDVLSREIELDSRIADARETFLSGQTPTRAMITGGVCSAYGFSTWGHLFTPAVAR